MDTQIWRPGDCVVCKCVKGKPVCVRPSCSDSSCVAPYKRKGECCPLCAVAPEIHSPHIIHPTECDFGGKKYAIGFSWLYNCRNYSCNENGQVSSVSVHCPAPNCTTTLGLHHQDKKKCCLICPGSSHPLSYSGLSITCCFVL
jgi:hypothetical protein